MFGGFGGFSKVVLGFPMFFPCFSRFSNSKNLHGQGGAKHPGLEGTKNPGLEGAKNPGLGGAKTPGLENTNFHSLDVLP